MALPQVVIVGRPNVGKSSLFNWLVGRRISIVDPTSGVTRDRISEPVDHDGQYFELIDTGGMGVIDRDGLTDKIERQIRVAIEQAAVVLFVVDAQQGVIALDQNVASELRRCAKPILCVANKCDNPKFENQAVAEFSVFGWDTTYVSVIGGRNRQELLEAIGSRLPEEEADPVSEVVVKVAVVGKRNAGKSTFINALARDERVIVSETPGTTRDSVDVRFERNGQTFVAIDTAGVQRRTRFADSIEFYSQARAERTVRRADVALLFVDAIDPVAKIDKQLAKYIVEQHKPCIFVVNKWDLTDDVATEEFSDYLDHHFPLLRFAPRAFVTATKGRNAQAVMDLSQALFNQAHERVSTGDLNRLIGAAMERNAPPMRRNRRPKIYYATQVDVAPPTIVLFCNAPNLFDAPYRRFLIHALREATPFAEIPIRLWFRRRHSDAAATTLGAEESVDDADSRA